MKEALERVKMLPAASGAPGTCLSFGKWTRRGWMGAGYLVARRLDPDGVNSHSSTASVRTDTMATQQTLPGVAEHGRRTEAIALDAVWILVAGAVLGVIAYHARMGAVSPRIANPEVTGVPRPVEFAAEATPPSRRCSGERSA